MSFLFSCEVGIFTGYKYYVDNLVAIARLRGHTLKTLHIAAHDILYNIGEPNIDEQLSLQLVSDAHQVFDDHRTEVCL
jgi:hypothetical protein